MGFQLWQTDHGVPFAGSESVGLDSARSLTPAMMAPGTRFIECAEGRRIFHRTQPQSYAVLRTSFVKSGNFHTKAAWI